MARNEKLASELTIIGKSVQRAIASLSSAKAGETRRAVAEDDLEKFRKLLKEHGWPTRELVGEQAGHYAFLVAFYASDRAFQEACLKLMEAANERSGTAALSKEIRKLTGHLEESEQGRE